MNKRIHMITGHYGSGKSEISVNMALTMAKEGKKIVFADLDIINPYFRSYEARSLMEEKGITVITTKYANTNVDIPALTADLSRYLKDEEVTLIMDIGGDDAGAKVIGRYRDEIPEQDANLYFVINCFRPETQTLQGVMIILQEVNAAARMKVNYLISNSHLMDATTKEDILKGRDFALEVSRATGIPIGFHAIMKNSRLKDDFHFDEPVFYMEKSMGLIRHLDNAAETV